MIISRRQLLLTSAAAGTAVMLGSRAFAATPPLAKKDTYKVGFAQTESNNPWRLAETKSMQDEAARLGYQLVYTDAAGSSAKQASDVQVDDCARRRRDLSAAARGQAARAGHSASKVCRNSGVPD